MHIHIQRQKEKHLAEFSEIVKEGGAKGFLRQGNGPSGGLIQWTLEEEVQLFLWIKESPTNLVIVGIDLQEIPLKIKTSQDVTDESSVDSLSNLFC